MKNENKILITVTLIRKATGSVLQFACTIDEYDFLEELYPGWELVS